MEDLSNEELKEILEEFRQLRKEREEMISYINSVSEKIDAFCEEVNALAEQYL